MTVGQSWQSLYGLDGRDLMGRFGIGTAAMSTFGEDGENSEQG